MVQLLLSGLLQLENFLLQIENDYDITRYNSRCSRFIIINIESIKGKLERLEVYLITWKGTK
jgi:hypothetical protein